MTQEEFALRVVTFGETDTYGSGLDDLLEFIKELIPILTSLFNCSASRMQRVIARQGIAYRFRLNQVAATIQERQQSRAVQYDPQLLAESFAAQAGNCSETELASVLQSA